MKILLTDDDNALRTHMSKALVRRGHHVLAVGNGKEAINRPTMNLLTPLLLT